MKELTEACRDNVSAKLSGSCSVGLQSQYREGPRPE